MGHVTVDTLSYPELGYPTKPFTPQFLFGKVFF